LQSIFAAERRNEEETVLYESGIRDWYNDPSETQSMPETLFPLDALDSDQGSAPVIALHPDFETTPKPKKVRVLTGLRPSSIAESQRLIPLYRALEPAATFGTVAGTLVHRWFEDIEWIDGYEFDPARAREQALDVLTPEQMPLIDIDEWIEKFAGYLRLDGVRQVLSREQYQIERLRAITARDLRLTIRNESRLLEFVEGTLLRGTIDRLVLVEDDANAVAAEIIDYKTDFFDLFKADVNLDDWIEAKKQRHGPQLRMYRDAVARIYRLPKERITMTLMLLSADVVTSIDG
jgi:ATP-dependent exoDNAse (exonuclease V) beta subunit